jgi:hypothetical protein
VAFVATVAVAVQPLSLSAQQTQRSGDSVVTLAADVADAAGRLLIGAQHLLEGDDPFVLMVGEIAYDGVLPEIAPLMAATMEDSLVQATSRMSVHRTVRVRTGVTAPSVPGGGGGTVRTGGAVSDLVVRVRGGGGPSAALFVVQILRADGEVLASTRVHAELDDAVRDALAPSTDLMTSGSGDDVPDSADAAILVGLDSILEALHLDSGDEDWFAVDIGTIPDDVDGIPAVSVYTRGSTDTYILAYGPDNPIQLITENDDSDGANAAVTFPVEASRRYWIQVRGYSSSVVGDYDLHIETTLLTIDQFEPNDRLEDAASIDATAGSLAASLRPAGDFDWFRVDSAAAGLPVATGVGEPGDPIPALVLETTSTLDTYISVYDENGVEVAANDDGGEAGNARVAVPLDGRPLLVEVRGFGSWVEGDYVLSWRVDEITFDAWEPDNSREEAREVVPDSGTREHTFSNDADVDWISFRLPAEGASAGTEVIIETYGEVDTYITLYDGNGTFIVASDDDGSRFNGRISRRLAPGTYFLEVAALYLDEAGMPYSIEVRTR